MKKLITSSVLFLMCITAYSQNTFPASGNVGIGLTSPQAKLDVSHTIRSQGQNTFTSGLGVEIRLRTFSGENVGSVLSYDRDNSNYLPLHIEGSEISLRESGVDILTVNDGKVGIGTSSPGAKLTVNASSGLGFLSKGNLEVRGNTLAAGETLATIRGFYQTPNSNSYLLKVGTSGGSYWERFVIRSDGNIGIGTITPTEDLSINANSARLSITGNSGSSAILLGNRDSNGVDNPAVINASNGHLFLGGGTSWDRGGTLSTSMTIHDSGNVGIGTTNPGAKLEIEGKENENGFKYNGDDGNNYLELGTWGIGSSRRGFLRVKDFLGEDRIVFTAANGNSWINTTGNVGIGTSNPDSKLSVNGKIHTKEVKVDLIGWSDFVFEKDYDLPTLKEVEQHIKEKGHLSSIPSAKEVEKNGIFLGEMNAKLLQKIEELTLYTIQQQKELEEKEEKISNLEKRLSKLEKLLTRK